MDKCTKVAVHCTFVFQHLQQSTLLEQLQQNVAVFHVFSNTPVKVKGAVNPGQAHTKAGREWSSGTKVVNAVNRGIHVKHSGCCRDLCKQFVSLTVPAEQEDKLLGRADILVEPRT